MKFTEEEIRLLQKLLSFKFEQRIPQVVNKSLNRQEQKTLTDLLGRGAVFIYKGGKYQEKGVYNITERSYSALLEAVRKEKEEKAAEEANPLLKLDKRGFVIIDSEMQARELSETLGPRIKKKELIGARGFDKKYYIVYRGFLTKYEGAVREVLKGGSKSIDQISTAIGLDQGACMAVLMVLNEQGDIIEKRKGLFALTD